MGLKDFLNGKLMDMEPLDKSGELELIKTTPGSYLGSCRYKLPENLEDAVYPLLFQKFSDYKIGYFFYIGGKRFYGYGQQALPLRAKDGQ